MTGTVLLMAAALLGASGQDWARMAVTGEDGVIGDLPLEHTEASIAVEGSIQLVTVNQVYGNPYDEAIETLYIFPLPESGAVYSMNMYIGDRHIEGDIRERMEAQRIYEEAISDGRTAALLEQERPNIFTQTVGNILPGDEIVIEIKYAAPVDYNNGTWEVVYPMVAGPRFNPENVVDADRITPDIVPEGTRSGYDIELSLEVNTGFEIREFESLNHEVTAEIDHGRVLKVNLTRNNEIPNRDFVFTYTTAGDDIGASVISHNGDMGGHFMLMLEPDAEVNPDHVAPKEIFFVVDNSGSMSGQPMEVAKETVRQFVQGMNPSDTFQIMRFSESASSMSRVPLKNTPGNVQRGIEYIESMSGMGGTMMIEGVRACVNHPEDKARMRYIIFLTDGYIGNETEILAELQTTLGENMRLFSIGVGSSPNRYLIEGLAEEGRGYAAYVGLDQDPGSAVEDIYEKINNPYLVNIEIDWGELDVADVYPSEIRDLYTGEPLVVVGRYDAPGSDEITVSGTIDGREWERTMSVSLVAEGGTEASDRLWARSRIHHLNRLIYNSRFTGKPEPNLIEQIIGLSLDYSVLSEYTAFVAVDSYARADGSSPERVAIPVNMPEGVSYDGIFGSAAGGMTRRAIPAYSNSPGTAGVTSGCEEMVECQEMEIRYAPSYSASLGSIDDYLGARPSEFRSVVMEVVDALNKNTEILEPGTVTVKLTLNSSGVITGVEIEENTTGVDRIEEIIRNSLSGSSVPGAEAGRTEFTILI
ncbi:hypothetical protein CSA37_02450 [Candidatus Fermentibacteria bacterium]|nr:MAG: hypothetical protein CSA37_02450 [Candidatus Fermentibacteria bacterium]